MIQVKTSAADQTSSGWLTLADKSYSAVSRPSSCSNPPARMKAVLEFEQLAKRTPTNRQARTSWWQRTNAAKKTVESERDPNEALKKNPNDV